MLTTGSAGANLGWPVVEGTRCLIGSTCNTTGFTPPIYEYTHSEGCSITGGYVVRDASLGDLYGRYLYADYCAGQLRSLSLPEGGGTVGDDRSEGLAVPGPTSFGEDSCGRLYVASTNGTVYRLVGTAEPECLWPTGPAAPASAPGAALKAQRPKVTLRLSSPLRRSHLRLTARISPCGGAWRRSVLQLNKGGRRLAAKRVDAGCAARFRPAVDGPTSFRALLLATPGGTVARSRRLRWNPGSGRRDQRSQVRTIALAKPIP